MNEDPNKNGEKIWISIFLRKGKEGNEVKIFCNFKKNVSEFLKKSSDIAEHEDPVLGGYRNSNNWFLITSERLIWHEAGVQEAISHSSIASVTVDFEKMNLQKRSLLDWTELSITTHNGSLYRLQIEPGMPFSGVWSVLKNIGERNRSAMRRLR